MLSFNYDENQVSEFIDKSLRRIHDTILEIEAEETSTFDSIFGRLLPLIDERQRLLGACTILSRVSEKEVVRISTMDACQMAGQFTIQTYLRRKLYAKIEALTDLTEKQTQVQQYWLRMCRQYGTHLTMEKQKEISKLLDQHEQVMGNFKKNLQQDKSKAIIRAIDLPGVSPYFLKQTERKRVQEIKPIHASTVYQYCTKWQTRHKVYKMMANRASENDKLFEKLHKLRTEISQALGFQNHLEFQMESGFFTPPQIASALVSLTKKYQETTKQEVKQCRETQDGNFEPCDIQSPLLSFDVTQSFPRKEIFTVLFKTFETLFNVSIVSCESEGKLWNKNTKAYKITSLVSQTQKSETKKHDSETGNRKKEGYVYFDIQDGYVEGMAVRHLALIEGLVPHGAILGTLPADFLHPQQILNLFHEFTHMIHQVLNSQEYSLISGLSVVPYDLVEVPALMIEEWVRTHLTDISKQLGGQLTSAQLQEYVKCGKQSHSKSYQLGLARADHKIFGSSTPLLQKELKSIFSKEVGEAVSYEVPSGLHTWLHTACNNYSGRCYTPIMNLWMAETLASKVSSLEEWLHSDLQSFISTSLPL